MTTSTSKVNARSKVLGSCNYNGPKKRVAVESFKQLFLHEIDLLDLSLSIPINESDRIIDSISFFYSKFYDRMENINSEVKAKELADDMKKDYQILSGIASHLLTEGDISAIAYSSINCKAGELKKICQLGQSCPYYVKNTFCMLYLDANDDDHLITEICHLKVLESRYIVKALLNLCHLIIKANEGNIYGSSKHHMLFMHILGCAKIYEMMNSSGIVREEFANSTLAILQADGLDVNSERYVHYNNILTEVFKDISEGKKRYIRPMANAIKRNQSLIQSGFDEERDIYCSLKATGQKVEEGHFPSLISSLYETDYYYKLFSEYDAYIGYKNGYKRPDDSVDIQNIYPVVRDILIDNPGKFKPRTIHIGDNAIQDRCNFIHRRLKLILNSLSTDCTTDQDKGRQFLKELTMEFYLSSEEDRKGIYCSDFSNATDSLDQHFQCRVIEFIFGPVVSNFWMQISQLPKVFIMPMGGEIVYTQKSGQPQGLLGSFDAFALAHHFIFLMDMKIHGWENIDPAKFYAVLGDDSTYNSVYPEVNYIEQDESHDVQGFYRSDIEIVHMDICENFANFQINHDKSDSAHYWGSEAKLDFAKVTFRNGELFTPVPFRLASNYAKLGVSSEVATVLWRAERGDDKASALLSIVCKDNPQIEDICRSGAIPYLSKKFQDKRVYNPQWINRVKLSNAVCTLSAAMAFLTLDDRSRDNFNSTSSLEKAMKGLFKVSQFTLIDQIPGDHKLNTILLKDADTVDVIRNILALEETDDKILTLMVASMNRDYANDMDLLDSLTQIARIMDLLRKCINSTSITDDEKSSLIDQILQLDVDQKKIKYLSDGLLTRGLTKRPREEVILLQNTISILNSLENILGIVPVTQPETALC